MDSVEPDNSSKCVEELTSENLIPPSSIDISDMFGDPLVLPRVGDDFQVEIPAMITESEWLPCLRNPADTEISFDVSDYFVMGLTIPVTWVDDKIYNHDIEGIKVNEKFDDSVNAKGSVGPKKAKKRKLISNKMGLKGKTLDVTLDADRESKSAISEPAMVGRTNPNQMLRSKNCCLVPGLLGESSWTDIEANSFVLALYIFDKNLIQVKRFMESKEMGEILSFYYGKFYGSDEQRRYADCQKMMKSRKCKVGHRVFTGWRQQELLSRLLPRVSKESQSILVEISKAFAEGKISLEGYVHTLKTTVGAPALIEAVGIGKGKENLTNLVIEPTKTKQVFLVEPELPFGKACWSLKSEDIIKFLTGDFRLSKARSNDIFWEAVWPRLLARGWHSEQPNNYGYHGCKHQLVFLMPGVKKFSREKLVKRVHYFDSVSDVLSRVASEPTLIEFGDDKPRVSSCQDANEREPESTINFNDLADYQQSCYLKPPISTFNSNLVKFTVVDTSLGCGTKSSNMRELRSLPPDTSNTSSLSIHLREIESDSSGDLVDEPVSDDMLLKGQKKTRFSNHAKGMVNHSNSNQRMPVNSSETAMKLVDNHEDQYIGLSNDKKSRTIKYQFTRRVIPGRSNLLPTLTKQRTLASCVKDEINCSMEKFMVGSSFKEAKPGFGLNGPDVSQVSPFHEKVFSVSSSTEGIPEKGSNEGILPDNVCGMETSPVKSENPQPQPLIDLNIPQVPSDSEKGVFFMEVDDSQQKPNAHVLSLSPGKNELVEEPNVLGTSIVVNNAGKHVNVNPKRQSTRNRPLTTRALEALASGFLSIKRRRKGTESQVQDNPVLKPYHRTHKRATVTSNSGSTGTSILDCKEGNGVDGVWNGNRSMDRNSRAVTEREVAQEPAEISKATYCPRVVNISDNFSS